MFLQALVEAVLYRIHTVLTDNGIQFADICRRTGRGHQRASVVVPSTGSVSFMASNIG